MSIESDKISFEARKYCIEHAAQNDFDMTAHSVPDWMKVGVEKFKAGEEITPDVLQAIDLHGDDAPRN